MRSIAPLACALSTPAAGAYYVAVYSASTDMETVIACGDFEPPLP